MTENHSLGRERRHYPRGSGACRLRYQGRDYALADWSAGGCAVPRDLPDAKAGDKVEIELLIEGPATTIMQRLTARVIRVEENATALEFLELSVAERDILLIAQGAFSENLYILGGDDESIPLG